VLAEMGFRPRIGPDLREMDAALFTDAPLGLGQRPPLTLDQRVEYRADDNLVSINFDALAVETLQDAELLADFLEERLGGLHRRADLIANYDNFGPGPAAEPRFFQILRDHERRYFRCTAGYCTDALGRRKLARAFAEAGLSRQIHGSFEEARHALTEHAGLRRSVGGR
jgi:hypothetical protein